MSRESAAQIVSARSKTDSHMNFDQIAQQLGELRTKELVEVNGTTYSFDTAVDYALKNIRTESDKKKFRELVVLLDALFWHMLLPTAKRGGIQVSEQRHVKELAIPILLLSASLFIPHSLVNTEFQKSVGSLTDEKIQYFKKAFNLGERSGAQFALIMTVSTVLGLAAVGGAGYFAWWLVSSATAAQAAQTATIAHGGSAAVNMFSGLGGVGAIAVGVVFALAVAALAAGAVISLGRELDEGQSPKEDAIAMKRTVISKLHSINSEQRTALLWKQESPTRQSEEPVATAAGSELSEGAFVS